MNRYSSLTKRRKSIYEAGILKECSDLLRKRKQNMKRCKKLPIKIL